MLSEHYAFNGVKRVILSLYPHLIIVEQNGCWRWVGYGGRYGQVTLPQAMNFTNSKKSRFWQTHRYSWWLEYGAIPKGMFVCHKCDNARCVNPAHLFLGTCGDNVRDCVRKGRHASQRRATPRALVR